MANAIFGFGPMGVLPEQPVKPEDKRRSIEGIASQSQVPANVLMALDEAGVKDTATAAQKIAADMKAGKSVDQIVGPDVMNRAYDIADQLYPRKPAAPPQSGGNLATDLAVEASGGAAQGVILGARGAGELATAAANSLINGPVNAAVRGATGRDLHVDLQNPLTAPTDAASNWVQGKIDANLTPETKQAIADSQITGDPLRPSTIDFGKDPSLRGIAAQGANVVGNLLPAFIMAVATGGAALPNAAAGMAMAAGDQAQSSDQFIDGLAAEMMPDGRSRLEAESPVYRNHIADGMSPSDALAATKSAASQLASIMSAPIGAIGGAIEGKLFNPAEKILEKSGWAARTLGRGAMGAATEGPQEMAEVVAGRMGTDAGAGTQQDLTQNTAGDLILGALGGHIGGTAAGAFSRREQEQNTGSDGSATGQDTAPVPGLPGSAPGAVSAIEPPAPSPSGPIGRVSAIAPDMTPVPEVPPPAPFFPDQKPGSAIRLYDPEADKIHESVFLGETPEGVDVRIDGEAITLSPQEFDQARDEAIRRDEEIKAAAKTGKKKSTSVQPSEKPAPPVDPAIDDAAAEALREAGYYDGPWNDVPPQDGSLSQLAVAAVKPPKPAKRAPDALTPEQALAQAKQIEETAKRGGWNKRLTTKHADLMAIANTGEKSDPVLDDGTQSAEPAAGNEPRDAGAVAGGKPASGQPPASGTEQGSPVGGNLQGDLVGATETGKPDGSLTANQKPRAPVTPMAEDPNASVQPDLLGGQPVTETGMAAKERRRREWGQFLPIAESTKSPWDGELEGRTVIVRPGKVTIRAKADGKSDQDRVIDTAGMGRDEIAAAARGALRELDRIAPISPPEPGPVAPPKKEQGAAVQALRDAVKLRDTAHDAYDADPTPENLKKTAQGADGPVSRAMKDLVDAVGNDKAQEIFSGIDAESEAVRRKAPAKATVENIREKAAVLRGVPKDSPPSVDGISLKWDDKEGGFIFSRANAEKVKAAVGIQAKPTQEPTKAEIAPQSASTATFKTAKGSTYKLHADGTTTRNKAARDDVGHEHDSGPKRRSSKTVYVDTNAAALSAAGLQGLGKKGARVALRNGKATLLWWNDAANKWGAAESGRDIPVHDQPTVGRYPLELWNPETDVPGYEAYSNMHAGNQITDIRTHSTTPTDREFADGFAEAPALVAADQAVTKEAVDDAAASADPNPTDAQKNVGNYQMGHVIWRGLDLSIETAKGQERTGTDSDGETWSVTMPAHYGYIKRTEGADGDHVDFYMGDNPESDVVVIVDQKDLKTRRFDEHKVMLGFLDADSAETAYKAGFSDGKGADRLGHLNVADVDTFKQWLEHGDMTVPASSLKGRAVLQLNAGMEQIVEADREAKRLDVKAAEMQAADRKKAEQEDAPEMVAKDGDPKPGNGAPESFSDFMQPYGHWAIINTRNHRADEYDTRLTSAQYDALKREFYRAGGKDPFKDPFSDASPDLGSDADRKRDLTLIANINRKMPEAEPDIPSKPKAKIEDFGEKLVGAAKDRWKGFSQRLGDVPDEDVANHPLSKSWPEPNYSALIEDGADPWTVAFIRAARAHIPRKPQGWKLKAWAESVKTLRSFARDLLAGQIEKQAIQEAMDKPSAARLRDEIMDSVDLYLALGHEQDLGGIKLQLSDPYFSAGKMTERRYEVVGAPEKSSLSHWPKVLAFGATKEDAIAAFKSLPKDGTASSGKARSGPDFLIYSAKPKGEDPYVFIAVKVAGKPVELRRFKTIEEARSYRTNNADELQQRLASLKEIPRERRETNSERIGDDHRLGADVSPEFFEKSFGFRGVQFGNYVEGARRQQDLNQTYDALMDLAGIIGIPPLALSLNGKMGLAFGARGIGGKNPAAAHYEPGTVVINLTKGSGAGSLAHEWFHALDNHFERARGRPVEYITNSPAPRGVGDAEDVRPEVLQAFADLREALRTTKLKSRSAEIDKMRSKPYWSTGIEMHARAFESYVIAKLRDQNATNDYLANIVSEESWKASATLTGLAEETYPYLVADEEPSIRAAFDNLFTVIQTRETDRGVEMYSRFENAQPVASLTGNELGKWEDIRQLGKKAEAWYRDNLVGQTVTNTETGWSIQFTNRGAKKIGSRKGDDLFRMVPALREIVESGRVVASESDSKGRPEIKTIHKIAATVMLNGVAKDVVATIRETNEGSFHYDLGRDTSDGARYFRLEDGYAAVRMSETQVRSPALEGDSVELNIDFADPEINATAIPVEALRAINTALAREIKASGLEGKVTPILVKSLLGRSGIPVQGRQRGAVVEVSELAADKVGVLRHEIVHALRDARLWERPFGLFTEQEWRALAQAARGDAGLMSRVATVYPDLSKEGQIEEAIAEVYREWAAARDGAGLVAQAFNKIAAFFRAFASALRGQGFTDAAMVMERIAGGKIGGRGPGGGVASQETSAERAPQSDAEMRPGLLKAQAKFKGVVGSRHWKNPGEFVSNLVTDAMAGKGDYSALALVPGRALFSELGKKFLSAKTYLRLKEEMDALRNDWHARSDKVAQEWLKMRNANPEANDAFMDLMHRSTLSGIDPSKEDEWKHAFGKAAENAISREGDDAPLWAHDVMQQIADHKYAYSALRAPFEALPPEFQALYGKVRAQYDRLGDDFESAVLRNIANATKIGLKRAERAHRKEMERIKDEGLEGEERDEAKAKADAALKAVKMRGGFSAKARIAALRKKFESNKLKGPYFPLARFGDYFVTVRNQDGAVVSFSRFEREAQQQTFIRELKESGETRYEFGTLDSSKKLRAQIDPSFVADIENMLAESGAGDEVMDAVWQRWLETLPDQSIRTAKIHRKGRRGYSNDAFRAFGKHMFHGAHQLARLEYGLPMEEALNEAEEEARVSDNPNRAGLLVAEMRKRHDFTMNPSGSSIVASMSGAAFIWYLGASPAAALANITQTTVVGIPLMSARFAKAGVTGTTKALGRAAKDFMAGKGQAENAPDLAPDERAALLEAVRRGTIDKTQAHDLASVAETGIEYNANREKWMRRIGWFFHQAERFNREVTFLAGYRLAKAEGMNAADAIDAAADITWKVHFDYQNTSRPRFMQNDLGKILTTFRQFTVNLIWRMFRDTHQALHGATKEERREARLQLVGVTLSMMAHAGIRGTWGYGLLMMLLGMLTPGADDDDIKEWLQDALVMEGDSPGVAAWNYAMGAALNGIPGQVLGVDLSERIGMPNLWFRDADNDLEGEDLYSHYVMELLGPAFGIGAGFFRGAQMAADGEWWRGTEAAAPKMVRDAMKTARYVDEGVQTMRGDTILDGVNPYQALMQLGGFTPAKIAERYDINSRLKDRERQITDERRDIQREAGDAALAGQDLPESVLAKIRDFNLRYPEYPITGDTIRQSARGRMQAQQKSEFGIVLNSKLNDRLRGERPPSIYN